MLLATRPPSPKRPRSLAEYESDRDGDVEGFLTAYASDLDEEEAAIILRAKALFIKRHLRVRLWSLFKLTQKVAKDTLMTAGAKEEDVAGFCDALSDAAGFQWRDHTVPESADFAAEGTLAVSRGPVASIKRGMRGCNTIGMTLAAEKKAGTGTGDWEIPESCYADIETLDPSEHEITEPELQGFVKAVIQEAGTKFGRYNFGQPFARRLGVRVGKRLKIPKGRVGNRNWGETLHNSTRNRKYVSAPCHESEPAHT